MNIFKCTIWKISTLVYIEVNIWFDCKNLVVSFPLRLSINKDENKTKTKTKPILVALSEASCRLNTITKDFQEHIF